jgi:PEP-CTERM motif
MYRFVTAGLMALALIVLSNESASAGSVQLGVSKAEVQAARVRLYEHEMHLRDENPAAFDHKYHLLGKILASEQGYDAFLNEHTFSKLLCVHTPFLWRVVDGDILYHRIHPFAAGLADHTNPGPHAYSLSEEGGTHRENAAGSGGPFSPHAVPEPSSWVLMASGLALALLALARRRIYLLATVSPQKCTRI